MADRKLTPEKTALLIQELQDEVITEGGAFASSGRLPMPRSRTSSKT
jgi:hypothetical protein